MNMNLAGTAFAVAVWLTAAAPAMAASVNEVEPNDTWANAQFIPNDSAVIVVTGSRTFANPSDDFYSFNVNGSGLLSITTLSAASGADSIIGLFNPAGQLIASNDDGPGLGGMSSLQFMVTGGMTGRYTLGFSGYNPGLLSCTSQITSCYDTDGDFVFDTFVAGGGAGGSTGWDYAITISGAALVPELPAAALLALGLPFLWLRKAAGQRRVL
jgi:hypothetical protein